MSILDLQRNQKGIQRLGTEWANLHAPGDGCLVYHTNGTIYSIFARNYNNQVIERRLYMSWSTDAGVTWTAPVQLTSGKFDDEPTAIQLDTGDTNSVIGVVYVSATTPATNSVPAKTLRRFTVDTSGVVQTPFDSLSVAGDFQSPCLVKIAAGFMVVLRDSQISPSLRYTTNTVFTNNSWTAASTLGSTNFLGASTNQIVDVSVTRMPNGHLCLIACARTALDGSSAIGQLGSNVLAGTVRCDVFAVFSDDDGATWGTPQNLTNYSGTPKFDLVGISTAISGIGVGLSDGTVAVAFQESIASQVINSSTSLAMSASPGFFQTAVYHATHNMLILCCNSAFGGDGGLLIFDLTNQTRTRLHTASTPALWVNTCQDLALSYDDKYLAVASNGSLDILDTTDPNPNNWTVTGIRTTSSPATLSDNMLRAKFASGSYTLFVAYGSNPSSANVWGFKIDASSPGSGITNLKYAQSGFSVPIDFYLRGNGSILIAYSNYIDSVSQSTGLFLYSTQFTSYSWVGVLYDEATSSILIGGSISSDLAWWKVTDTGSAFTLGTGFYTPTSTTKSDPAIQGVAANWAQVVPGYGAILNSEGDGGYQRKDFYSFPEGTFYGVVHNQSWNFQNEYHVTNPGRRFPDAIKSDAWLLQLGTNTVAANHISKRGRLRWTIFTYNSGTKQLNTSGVDFYDMLNTLRLDATSPLSIRRFGMIADSSDQLYTFLGRYDLHRSSQLLAALNGTVEPDAYKLQMRARILNTYTQTFTARARIRQTYTTTLDSRARIVFAQCLKMQARIVPISTETLQMRARIIGAKRKSLLIDYDVAADKQLRCRMTFFVNNGYNTSQTIGMGARIAPVYRRRFTGYFLVSGQRLETGIQFGNYVSYRQTLAAKAFITK